MADEKASSFVLRSNLRRPLTFRVAGKTVRLSPGERLEVTAGWLRSAELQRLLSMGSVATDAPPAPKVEHDTEQTTDQGAEQATEQDASAGGETRRPRTAKNPPTKRES